ncbi:hypothetical protein BC827DRAFT_1171552 [Russula dissimulans]|nr:hypothetical protein BC827DRAFT_1171552 [Russula dissimulans]
MSLTSTILLSLMALLTQIRIVDRDSAAGNLSCGYERPNRRKRGGTPQVEIPQRREHFPTSIPSPGSDRQLQGGGNARHERTDQLHFLHASKRAEQLEPLRRDRFVPRIGRYAVRLDVEPFNA